MCARKIFLHARKNYFWKNICEKYLWKSRVFQESQKRKKERGKIAPRFYAVQTEQKYLFLSVFEILKFWNRGKNFWFSCFFIFKNIFQNAKVMQKFDRVISVLKKSAFLCTRSEAHVHAVFFCENWEISDPRFWAVWSKNKLF